ncbi:MAG: hypothetical protein HY315_09640 [Acidobacteria bacterium]|nr:hypothetical protein [Acidobacteriota bacterium]
MSGNKPTPLFWFTASEIFNEPRRAGEGTRPREVPRFIADPDLIFQKVWATPLMRDSTELVSLLD